METFDYIIIGLGIALIAIGLFLFISGKRDSENANHVEGFGIKLNVSNPSIILIVFGIGLVLFPRLMPNHISSDISGGTQPAVLPTENQEHTPVNTNANENTSATVNTSESSLNASQAGQQSQTQSSRPAVFFPQGTWYLTQYQENGVDLSNNITGNIKFSQRNSTSQDWYAEMLAVDGWGNLLNHNYSGVINALPGGYNIDTQNSNDPTFVRQAASQLTMKMDNPNSLHMEYWFNGSAIILHWSQ